MTYNIDYYGFVYEWTDNGACMKYIGSHHGSADDSYKGSNIRFQRAIKKRPLDFVRKILEYSSIDNKNHTLVLEQKWLDLVENIKDNTLYYNQKNEACGGWSFITDDHIKKRSSSLKEKHAAYGLSEKEIKSYKAKIKKRLDRISKAGFTEKEKEQHSKYGYKIRVIDIENVEYIFDSCSKAKKALNIDVQYGLKVCSSGKLFKGYNCIKINDPIIDCRGKHE